MSRKPKRKKSKRHKKASWSINTLNKYDNNCYLKKCESFDRIAHILSRYHTINANATKQSTKNQLIIEYIENKYSGNIINDYHHILIKHLSHSDHTKNIENFQYINSQIINAQNIKCDITKCQHFKSHNKDKLDLNNNTYYDNKYYLNLLCSIHIYFVHGIDSGFRSYTTPNIMHSHPKNKTLDQEMINQLLLFNFGDRDDIITAMRMATNKHDVNEIIDILKEINTKKQKQLIAQLSSSEFYDDEQLNLIKNQIKNKHKFLTSIRGKKRMKNNKFCTKIGTSFVIYIFAE